MDKYQGYVKEYFRKATMCVSELREKLPNVTIHLAQSTDQQAQQNYFAAAQIFNTRLQQNPLAIVYCECAEHVSEAYNTAIEYQIPVRVRAGGHDHEGESSGTNVVLIDVSKMTAIEIDSVTGIAKIGAGNRFNRLTAALADKDVMIAHGTCATVGITGFTLGGGWGPWTRKMGMNCEHLKGATLMLGNGEIIDIDEDENGNVPDLLWALRGGGGMSYGLVTELRIQTFKLPEELIKFELQWNSYSKDTDPNAYFPTLKILQTWEKVIKATDTPQLIGTNLKINAIPAVDNFDYTQIHHGCCMYGYWEGTEEELKIFVKKRFESVPTPVLSAQKSGSKEQYTTPNDLMGSWGRDQFVPMPIPESEEGWGQGTPIPPDLDDPAPHKITSRFVNSEGLDEEGYKQLLLSLTSPLIQLENRDWNLFTYVTLGAIVGDYYRNNLDKAENSAFPYKDKLYTIQYQAWWNAPDPNMWPENGMYDDINRAMDWIDTARNFVIPNTSGAFISFKDIAVPTSTYFGKSYERLKKIKAECSKDPFNYLRTRKTII